MSGLQVRILPARSTVAVRSTVAKASSPKKGLADPEKAAAFLNVALAWKAEQDIAKADRIAARKARDAAQPIIAKALKQLAALQRQGAVAKAGVVLVDDGAAKRQSPMTWGGNDLSGAIAKREAAARAAISEREAVAKASRTEKSGLVLFSEDFQRQVQVSAKKLEAAKRGRPVVWPDDLAAAVRG